ncbi:hypothetical protein QAD02_011429 [Eretmocerus hayati]|uniref:Uncharacterized protein n=1 Tax=Eretmocerus hayati TaxID=131215 RepID=A0ACC2NXR1_9HYME|nr:hypothetical protein QAD02_011429 [Eretmocerus hayati]
MEEVRDLKLELVQVLFRHGARTCNKSEATIPMPQHIDKALHDKYDYGQLTNVGKAQAHKLGCLLRERYGKFLGDSYHPRDVHAYSSDFDRTKASLQLVLAGLYPPSSEEKWNSDLDWMPIPFHSTPQDMDHLLLTFKRSRYQKLLQDAMNSPTGQEKLTKMHELHDFFMEKGIDKVKEYGFIAGLGIHNVLSAHKSSKCVLPVWYTEELFTVLRERVVDLLDLMSLTAEMRRLIAGSLIRKFRENMDIEGKFDNPRKIYLFSGHELNLAAFTRAHGISDEFKYPDYSSAVILEKWRDPQGKIFVRMLGRTGPYEKFLPLKLGDSGDFCPIDEYLKMTDNLIPADEELLEIINDRGQDLLSAVQSDYVFRSKTPVIDTFA